MWGTGWSADIDRILGVNSQVARSLLSYICRKMSPGHLSVNTNLIRLRDEFPNRVTRSYGLKELEKLGIIKKGSLNRIWETIWVNPDVLCPTWLSKKELDDVRKSYVEGPQERTTIMAKGAIGDKPKPVVLSAKEKRALKEYRRVERLRKAERMLEREQERQRALEAPQA